MKTSELTGRALDWAVALSLGFKPVLNPFRFGSTSYGAFDSETGYAIKHYGLDWSQGGPIIEREKINLTFGFVTEDFWFAELENLTADDADYRYGAGVGPTPLIAAMRAYVASKLGNEVEIPDELR